MARVRIGITLGDINGIGPEVALKAAARKWPRDLEIILVGSEKIIRQQARKFGSCVPIVWDPRPHLPLNWTPGRMDARAAWAAADWIHTAAHACLSGGLDGMVTAPISKECFHYAGILVPGHTEFLAAITKTKRYAMMLFGGPLRVVIVTRHVPLAQVPKLLTKRTLSEAIELTAEALPWLGAKRGRIAVCGLNPHAGEGGDIGREEITTIAPVIQTLKKRGLKLSGPLPADTVFHYAARGDYDAVVAMYHDQGLAPLKLLAFETGVNVTLGLPIVRTSPDHGTAFDIAGRGVANPASMVEAVCSAYALAKRKNPWA
jgi:4-hydroxythreonine-4-phosphate dehydrogenase